MSQESLSKELCLSTWWHITSSLYTKKGRYSGWIAFSILSRVHTNIGINISSYPSVQIRWRPEAWEVRHLLCLPNWHAGSQLPAWPLHRCEVQPFTWCRMPGLSIPPPSTVSAVALWTLTPNVLQNVCILQQVDTLIHHFPVFHYIWYY